MCSHTESPIQLTFAMWALVYTCRFTAIIQITIHKKITVQADSCVNMAKYLSLANIISKFTCSKNFLFWYYSTTLLRKHHKFHNGNAQSVKRLLFKLYKHLISFRIAYYYIDFQFKLLSFHLDYCISHSQIENAICLESHLYCTSHIINVLLLGLQI